MPVTRWMLAGTLAAAHAVSAWSAQGDGLIANADQLPWARLQGRLSFTTQAPVWRSDLGANGAGLKVNAVSVMGDYYFTGPRWGTAGGGFRATSGVIVGPRSQVWPGAPGLSAQGALFSVDRRLLSAGVTATSLDASNDTTTLPYVGIGYTGLSARGGWSFSADLGMVALSPSSAVKLGRVFGGGQNLDDQVRDMRLSPVLQLGVSYSF